MPYTYCPKCGRNQGKIPDAYGWRSRSWAQCSNCTLHEGLVSQSKGQLLHALNDHPDILHLFNQYEGHRRSYELHIQIGQVMQEKHNITIKFESLSDQKQAIDRELSEMAGKHSDGKKTK